MVELKGGGFTASREKLKDKNEAQAISVACNGKIAEITKINKQNKSVSPPKIYDLTTLQREANKLFGYTASETLALAQSLYEKKLITYPRTDSRYITGDMAHGIDDLVTIAGNVVSDAVGAFAEEFTPNVKVIVNNSKVTDHHAILPTVQMSKNLDSLMEQEKNILLMICVRLISAVSEKHTFTETAVTIECNKEIFTAKGKIVIVNGWKQVEETFTKAMSKSEKTDSGAQALPKDLSEN